MKTLEILLMQALVVLVGQHGHVEAAGQWLGTQTSQGDSAVLPVAAIAETEAFIYFQHTSIKWKPEIAQLGEGFPTVFAKECYSNMGLDKNPYGWEYWKAKGKLFGTKAGNRSPIQIAWNKNEDGRALGIQLNRFDGFAVAHKETIKCGPFNDKDGYPYYSEDSGDLLGVDDKAVFDIDVTPTYLLGVGFREVMEDSRSTAPHYWYESHVRVLGLTFFITLFGDAWVGAHVIPFVFRSLQCSPSPCLQGILMERHFSWSPETPNHITVNVSAEECRKYNLNEKVTNAEELRLVFPDLGGKEYPGHLGNNVSYRGYPLQDPANPTTQPYVKIYAHQLPPTVSLQYPVWTPTPGKPIPTNFDLPSQGGVIRTFNNTFFRFSEDCIRGKFEFAIPGRCSLMYNFIIQNDAEFPNGNTFRDANKLTGVSATIPENPNPGSFCPECRPREAQVKQGEFGVTSTLLPHLSFKRWIDTIMPNPRDSKSLGFFTSRHFPEYDIDVEDTIRLRPVFDTMERECQFSPDVPGIDGAPPCSVNEFRSEPPIEYVTDSTYASNLLEKCGLPALEWARDTMGYLPGVSMPRGSCPLLLTISPSPGRVFGDLPAGFQSKDIWMGGATAEIILDGESFTEESKIPGVSTLDWIITKVTGNILASSSASAFNGNRDSCIFPKGSTRFGVNSETGKTNFSVIVFTFAPCDDYLIAHPATEETITFLTESDMLSADFPKRSREDLIPEQSSGLNMTITRSPSFISYLGETTFEEADVIAGRVTFSLQLRGDLWINDPVSCFNQFATTWSSVSESTTTAVNPSSAPDPRSFANLTLRSLLAGAQSPAGTWLVNSSNPRILTFHGTPAGAEYDTLKGETLFLDFTKFKSLCFVNGVAPQGNITLTILPQNGDLSLQLQHGWGTAPFDPPLTTTGSIPMESENRLRRGTTSILISVADDTFEDVSSSTQQSLSHGVYKALRSLNAEPSGFTRSKANLTHLIQLMSPNLLNITLQGYLKYDILANETLQLLFPQTGAWMSSGRVPTNPNVTLEIFATAGQVTLANWSGEGSSTTNMNGQGGVYSVNEGDFRLGRVWFSFAILGDQWRQQREPFVESFSSDDTALNNVSFGSLVGQMVPSMIVFEFTTDSQGFEYMRIGFQSSERFNVNSDETVTLQLNDLTVASGIPPVFWDPIHKNESSTFQFIVKARPGKLVMSGTISRLTEKMFRQGFVKVFLTLIGELWGAPGATTTLGDNTTLSVILSNMRVIPNPANNGIVPLQGFERSKNSLLKISAMEINKEGNVLALSFIANRKYNIDNIETIEISILGANVKSGFAPVTPRNGAPLLLKVLDVGGELSYPRRQDLTEDQIRSGAYITLQLDGDVWQFDEAKDPDLRTKFLTGFGSLSAVSQEPHGFLTNELGMMKVATPQLDVVTIEILPTPGYDIENEEILTFTLPNSSYVETGKMPDPNVVYIPVRPAIRYLVVLADENSQLLGGAVNLARFSQSIASMLNCDLTRVNLRVNETAYRAEDNLKVLILYFSGTGGSSSARTNAELGGILISLQQDFLIKKLGAKWVYYLDSPPPYEDIHDAAPTGPGSSPPDEESVWVFVAWSVGSILFILLLVGGYFVFMYVFFGSTRWGSVRVDTEDDSRSPGEDQYGIPTEHEKLHHQNRREGLLRVVDVDDGDEEMQHISGESKYRRQQHEVQQQRLYHPRWMEGLPRIDEMCEEEQREMISRIGAEGFKRLHEYQEKNPLTQRQRQRSSSPQGAGPRSPSPVEIPVTLGLISSHNRVKSQLQNSSVGIVGAGRGSSDTSSLYQHHSMSPSAMLSSSPQHQQQKPQQPAPAPARVLTHSLGTRPVPEHGGHRPTRAVTAKANEKKASLDVMLSLN